MRNFIKKIIQRWQWIVFILALIFVVVFFSSEPKYLSIITGIWTMIVSLAVISISYWQWETADRQRKIAEDKLRLELFDKRYQIYMAAQNLIGRATSRKGFEETYFPYVRAVVESNWILDDSVHEYLTETLSTKVLRLYELRDEKEIPTNDVKRRDIIQESSEINQWLNKQPLELEKMFRPYMTILNQRSKVNKKQN